MAFSLVDITTTSTSAVLEFEFTGGDSNYANYRPLKLTIPGKYSSGKTFDSDNKGGGDSYWTIEVTGLDPDTTYTVEAQLGYYSTNTTISWLSLYADGEFTTDPAESLVDPWSWTSSTERENALAILEGRLPANGFSAQVWNDLVDKIAEVREARGYSWSNGYATMANTKVEPGDTLTAVRFNSIWHNIEHLKGTDLSAVEPGDEILGSYITILTDTLNAIIGNL